MTKVIHLSFSDAQGGAARAAYRIHRSLRASGVDSSMLVNIALTGDWTVHSPSGKHTRIMQSARYQMSAQITRLLRTGNPALHSPALIPSSWPSRINASDVDVVHLHWLQGEMLSIYDIASIRKPVLWTLHDMWPFCGAEHYTIDYRWRDGYRRDNRPDYESGFDLNRYTWQRKRKYWRRPIQIVSPSKWLAACVRASALMYNWPVSVVPNPIDTEYWQPIHQYLARQHLGLPLDGRILLFGAIGGTRNYYKGFDLLSAALHHLRQEPSLHGLRLVVFGQHAPQSPPRLGFPLHYLGHLYDDLSLRVLYSAADVMVIPSRLDNLPNTGLEAHACGTPVVGFNICGLSDIITHKKTGYLAQPFSCEDLSSGIRWVLQHPQAFQLRLQARRRAVELWSYPRVSDVYKNLYQTVVSAAGA